MIEKIKSAEDLKTLATENSGEDKNLVHGDSNTTAPRNKNWDTHYTWAKIVFLWSALSTAVMVIASFFLLTCYALMHHYTLINGDISKMESIIRYFVWGIASFALGVSVAVAFMKRKKPLR